MREPRGRRACCQRPRAHRDEEEGITRGAPLRCARCGSRSRDMQGDPHEVLPAGRSRETRIRRDARVVAGERDARAYRSGPTTDTAFAVPLPSPLPLARERESLVSTQRPPSRPGARGQSPRLIAEAAEPIRLWRCRRRRGNQTSHGPPPEAAGMGGRRAPACALPFARDAVARSAPRDRRDREGNRWAELDPRRPCLRERTRLSQRPIPTVPSQSLSPTLSRSRGRGSLSSRDGGRRADRVREGRALACSPKRRSRFGGGGAEGAAPPKPATDHPQKRRARGGDERPRARRRSRAMR